MLVRRISLRNVRSFLETQELKVDGPMTIVIGPNGGGKTNLLDTLVIVLRKFLFASMYAQATNINGKLQYQFAPNENLSGLKLERHSQAAADSQQLIEIEVEVTQKDIENIRAMASDAKAINDAAGSKYLNVPHQTVGTWDLTKIKTGDRCVYKIENEVLQQPQSDPARIFLGYLRLFEIDSLLRDEFGFARLATPMVYLPVTRSASGFQTSVQLSNYNPYETKKTSDAAISRSGTTIVTLAVSRLAQKYRLLLENDKGGANQAFRNDQNLQELTRHLKALGYDWDLKSINPLTNEYDVQLSKQGTSFLVGAASSGERELLTYLFAVFALNVRDALVVVDEPELHLHPKWQRALLTLFTELTATTGNQFVFATHSPTFVSPRSIQFVSRVYSQAQKSQIIRLDTAGLPEAKHLFSIINSQNNERLFFADEVILVEGLSDRIFFEAILDELGRRASFKTIEVLSVGGKGFFAAYAQVLRACRIPFSIIADLDYIEQIGSGDLRGIFTIDAIEIKKDVVENVKSRDGEALVRAIDAAMATKSWDHAIEVWNYIKRRRQQLSNKLSQEQAKRLEEFILDKRAEKIFLLKLGTLESYLPPGHMSKDLEKLIRLLGEPDFWLKLPQIAREELQEISTALLT